MFRCFPWLAIVLLLLLSISLEPCLAKPSLDLDTRANPTPNLTAQSAPSKDQSRRTLKVAVIDGPPWCMKDEDGHWTGMTIDLLREIAEELHFDYDFKETTLKGVQEMVHNSEVDLAGAGLAITAEREEKFDFSAPYCVFDQTVAVNADQQPSLVDIIRSTFLSWGFLVIVLSLATITLVGAFVFWLLEQKGDSEYYAQKDWSAFARSILWSIMVLAGREMPKSIGFDAQPPKTNLARGFAVAWMMVGILLLSLFTAGAASFLTSRQMQSIVNSPDDLRHVRCATVTGAAAQAYMDRHNIKYTTYPNDTDLLNALVARKIDAAVYASVPLSYYAKTSFSNKIVVLRFSLRHDFVALALPPDSSLRKALNAAILHVLESKRWQTIVSKYVTEN
ncbi:MAG TPA: transporter substrate-binding domain-containing protein [Oculatellaceae cyanobacterium]